MRLVDRLIVSALIGLVVGCDDDSSEVTPTEGQSAEAATEAEAEPETTAPPSAGVQEEQAPAMDRETALRVRQLLRRARTANREGRRDAAIEHYEEAVEADPSGRALCELGWVQFQAGRLDEAERSLTGALIRLPTRDPVPEPFAGAVGACFYNRGRLHEARGEADEAARRMSAPSKYAPATKWFRHAWTRSGKPVNRLLQAPSLLPPPNRSSMSR